MSAKITTTVQFYIWMMVIRRLLIGLALQFFSNAVTFDFILIINNITQGHVMNTTEIQSDEP